MPKKGKNVKKLTNVTMREFEDNGRYCVGISLLEEPEFVVKFPNRARRMNFIEDLNYQASRIHTAVQYDFYANEDVKDYEDIGERIG